MICAGLDHVVLTSLPSVLCNCVSSECADGCYACICVADEIKKPPKTLSYVIVNPSPKRKLKNGDMM